MFLIFLLYFLFKFICVPKKKHTNDNYNNKKTRVYIKKLFIGSLKVKSVIFSGDSFIISSLHVNKYSNFLSHLTHFGLFPPPFLCNTGN